jgi:hypothetical protein
VIALATIIPCKSLCETVWQNATNLQILDDAQWGTRKMCCDERTPNALAIVVVSCYDDTNESNFSS